MARRKWIYSLKEGAPLRSATLSQTFEFSNFFSFRHQPTHRRASSAGHISQERAVVGLSRLAPETAGTQLWKLPQDLFWTDSLKIAPTKWPYFDIQSSPEHQRNSLWATIRCHFEAKYPLRRQTKFHVSAVHSHGETGSELCPSWSRWKNASFSEINWQRKG